MCGHKMQVCVFSLSCIMVKRCEEVQDKNWDYYDLVTLIQLKNFYFNKFHWRSVLSACCSDAFPPCKITEYNFL